MIGIGVLVVFRFLFKSATLVLPAGFRARVD